MTELRTQPPAVKNLQKLWEEKKKTFEYTQTKAAKELGWTQGAFSQYLNNLTDLNDSAIIKLANFLDVDPNQIDPEFNERSTVRWRKLPKAVTLTGLEPAPKIRGYLDNTLFDKAQLIYCDVDLPPIAARGSYLMVCNEKHVSMQSRVSSMHHDLWGVYQEHDSKDAPWCVSPYVDIPANIEESLKRVVISTLWI